jgi:hypothetical protein
MNFFFLLSLHKLRFSFERFRFLFSFPFAGIGAGLKPGLKQRRKNSNRWKHLRRGKERYDKGKKRFKIIHSLDAFRWNIKLKFFPFFFSSSPAVVLIKGQEEEKKRQDRLMNIPKRMMRILKQSIKRCYQGKSALRQSFDQRLLLVNGEMGSEKTRGFN